MGLRLKITLALLLLALVPLGVATAILVSITRDKLELSTKEYRLATAEVAVSAIQHQLERADAELATVGAALARQGATVDQRMADARAHLLGGRHVKLVAIYDPRGRRVDTLRVAQVATPAEPPAQLSEALRGVARTERGVHLTVARAGGAPYLPVLIPVYQGSQKVLYAYLWTAISLQPLSNLVSGVSARRFGKQVDRVFVVDHGFRVIAHGVPGRLWSESRGEGIARGIKGNRLPRGVAYAADYEADDGRQMLGVLVPLSDPDWAVVVQQPRAEAYVAVTTTLQTGLAVGAAFAVLALVLGLMLGRRLTAPVLAVADAAGKVASGDFEVQVPVGSRDEVGQLGQAFNTMTRDLRSYRERVVEETRIRTDLSRYLGAELVEQVVDSELDLELGGKRQQITVLFADVVSFTPLAEKHPPEFVVGILNELFTFMTEIVFKHGGVVDKFMGDCVMAVFGAPHGRDDDAQRAVECAAEMLRWLEVGNAKWSKDLGRQLELGIGVNTGMAVVGNIGSKKRMEYTVIGDVVNVASRLENLARPGQVLMTRATAELVADAFDHQSMGSHNLMGRGEPVEVFALDTD